MSNYRQAPPPPPPPSRKQLEARYAALVDEQRGIAKLIANRDRLWHEGKHPKLFGDDFSIDDIDDGMLWMSMNEDVPSLDDLQEAKKLAERLDMDSKCELLGELLARARSAFPTAPPVQVPRPDCVAALLSGEEAERLQAHYDELGARYAAIRERLKREVNEKASRQAVDPRLADVETEWMNAVAEIESLLEEAKRGSRPSSPLERPSSPLERPSSPLGSVTSDPSLISPSPRGLAVVSWSLRVMMLLVVIPMLAIAL